MKAKRLMEIDYPHKSELVEGLKTVLTNANCPYVVFDDVIRYRIYIDKGSNTWNQVMHEVNSVHAVKFRYRNDCYIENGKLYQPSFISMAGK